MSEINFSEFMQIGLKAFSEILDLLIELKGNVTDIDIVAEKSLKSIKKITRHTSDMT